MTDKNIDQAKGRLKEAAGVLTGDRGLKSEGRADQAKGSLKKAVDRVAQTVKGHNRADAAAFASSGARTHRAPSRARRPGVSRNGGPEPKQS